MDMIRSKNGAGIAEAYYAFYDLCESEAIDHVKSLPHSRLGQVEGVSAGSAMAEKAFAQLSPWFALPLAGVVAGWAVR
jgi:hypothetical protein